MDLLGSIMNSMDKPPSLSEKEKMIIKSEFLPVYFFTRNILFETKILNPHIKFYEKYVVSNSPQKEKKRWRNDKLPKRKN